MFEEPSMGEGMVPAAGGKPATELREEVPGVDPASEVADGPMRPSQHAVAMAREAVLEESLVYSHGRWVIEAGAKSISTAESRGLASVLRPSRFFTWGPFILGLVPLGVALAPFVGHLTRPSPTSLAYYSWRDPIQSVTIPYVVGWTLAVLLCWAYAWWNLKLRLTVDEGGFVLEKAWQPRLDVAWTNVTSVGWQNPSRVHGGGPAIEYQGDAGQPRRIVVGGMSCAVPSIPALMAIETAWARSRGAQGGS